MRWIALAAVMAVCPGVLIAQSNDDAYLRNCSGCHGPELRGGETGPALIGSAFQERWGTKPPQELDDFIRRTMPPANPASLSAADYASALARIRRANEWPVSAAVATLAASSAVSAPTASSESRPRHFTEWLANRGDPGSMSYSPLSQINRDNFGTLRIAWRWKSDNFGPTPEFYYRATPVMADGVLYTTAGIRRTVVAIDATTGETLWMYRLDEGDRSASAPRRNSGRGVAYWRSPNAHEPSRVYTITPGFQLIALDARTGQPIQTFGKNGIVDLKEGLPRVTDVAKAPVGSSSPPVIVRDVIVVGTAFAAGGAPRSKEAIPGWVRGYDVHTGALEWTFHTIPEAGEFGNETWKEESWRYTGNAGVWTAFSADAERGYVYLPLEAPTGDFYGGHRQGDNLFSDSPWWRSRCRDERAIQPLAQAPKYALS
jgi:quinoprotein glucose dehydrogenase